MSLANCPTSPEAATPADRSALQDPQEANLKEEWKILRSQLADDGRVRAGQPNVPTCARSSRTESQQSPSPRPQCHRPDSTASSACVAPRGVPWLLGLIHARESRNAL